jgi:hypothetical protein
VASGSGRPIAGRFSYYFYLKREFAAANNTIICVLQFAKRFLRRFWRDERPGLQKLNGTMLPNTYEKQLNVHTAHRALTMARGQAP